MGLRDASLGDLYAVWTIVFTIGFSIIGLMMAPNNFKSIAVYVGAAASCAQAVAALFAAVMYAVIQVAP